MIRTSPRRRRECTLETAERGGGGGEGAESTGRFGAARCATPTGTMTGTRTGGDGGGEGGSPNILVALYVATAGLQGNALGSDEEEITLLVYVLIDELQNKVTRSEERRIERRRGRDRPRRKWFATDELTRDLSFCYIIGTAMIQRSKILSQFCFK